MSRLSLSIRVSALVSFILTSLKKSVPHQRLLMKLDCMGIRGYLLSWIAAFLYDREQRVLVEGQSFE